MDLRLEIKRKAEKLAEDDYIKKYHRLPELSNTVDWTMGFGEEIVIAFEADDMAYYKFVYHVDSRKWEMYVYYRDSVKEWVEE